MDRRYVIARPASQAKRRGLLAAVVACASIVLTQGSGARAAGSTRTVTTTARQDPVAAEAAIPTFDLLDLRNGRSVDLARLRTPGRAMLVWLWAPG